MPGKNIIWLVSQIIGSFYSTKKDKGLPLGNLTSQLFANIYMNEFDQFVKHRLKAKYYVRYADDFVLLSGNRDWLEEQIPRINNFLQRKLKLNLHSQKVFIKTLASGVDFLGWVHFPDHMVLRATARRRIMRNIRINPKPQSFNSYFGLLQYGNTGKIQAELLKKHILLLD